MPVKLSLPFAAPRSALHYRPVLPPDATQVPPRPRTSILNNKQVKSTNPPIKVLKKKPEVWLNLQHFFQNKLLWLVVLSMLIGMVLVTLGQFAINWGTSTYNDIHYGNPRTYQVDAFVGHEKGTVPSHFIALNLKGRVEIIEFPGGDPTHTRIFVGPQLFGSNVDLIPVTLQFSSSGHSKLPDMLVYFQNTHITFHNVHGTFQQ